jgi:hypothetical protein
MTSYSRRLLARAAARCAAAVSLAAVGIALTGCNLDKTLKVQDVDVATPESTASAAGLPVLYGGGLADFQQQMNYVDGTVDLPGLLSDELRDIDTFPTRISVDQRGPIQINNGTVQQWLRYMQQARASLERGASAFAQFAAKDARRGEMHALEGLMYVYFGEDFCNGMPYSEFTNGNPVYGAPTSNTQSFQLAVAEADSALAIIATSDTVAQGTLIKTVRNLASVVKGRAQLDLNQPDLAAAAVANVPLTFQYDVYNSTNSSRENNGIYINVGPLSKRYAVSDGEGPNTIPFRTLGWNDANATGDARVRYYKSGIGQDGQSTAYYTLKYPDYGTPIVVADGVEAQLITAEDKLHNNDDAGWLGILNALRANTALLNSPPYTIAGQKPATALAALTDPGTDSTRVDLMFQERALWMYLTGHRLGDLRRLVRQYNRADAQFPSGTYGGAAGGPMGSDFNFPISIDEQNNTTAPNGCTDRKA